jgi:hypothetical protein
LILAQTGNEPGAVIGARGRRRGARPRDYAVGNFDIVTINGTAQTRTANAQNEITGISSSTTGSGHAPS